MALLRSLGFLAIVTLAILGGIWLDSALGLRGVRVVWLGQILVLAGALLIVWCVGLFARLGKGTPNPFLARTKRLVTIGPYRYVRNPMMWGVGTVLVGLAFWLGGIGLWFIFAFFLLFVRSFVRHYEEPDMERRFGDEYREYCRRVPRWWPRFGQEEKRT